MKRIALGLALTTLLSTGCAKNTAMSSAASLATNPLVTSLTSGLGLNATQAMGGAGALLGLASENLAKADWTKVANAVPGVNSLISEAKTLGGITGKFTSLANLSGAFTKMGLSADQVKTLTPAMTDFISKSAGPEVGNLFAGAIH